MFSGDKLKFNSHYFMFSGEAGLFTIGNENIWEDYSLPDQLIDFSLPFSDQNTNSSMDQPELYDSVSSTKQPQEKETTTDQEIPVVLVEKTPAPEQSKFSDILSKNLSETSIKQSCKLISYYHTTITNFAKLPEGKRRHVSAPFDDDFLKVCTDEKFIINAKQRGLIPKRFWEKASHQTFGWCLLNFFQKKNNVNTRFLYKLYNALVLQSTYPELESLIGVAWVNKKVFKVNKHIFGRFIGIKSVDNSLFHQQGNFPSHGFMEISSHDVNSICPDVDLEGVDFDIVRLMIHVPGIFVKGCTESQISHLQHKK